MVQLLAIVLAAMGVGAWAVVVFSAAGAIRRVPAGQKLRALSLLGRWQFAAVAHLGGDATIAHSNRFLKAMMFFLGVVVCGVVLAAVAFIDGQAGGTLGVSSVLEQGSAIWVG